VALCAVPQSIDISYGQAHSTKPAAAGLLLYARAGQTDGPTDGWTDDTNYKRQLFSADRLAKFFTLQNPLTPLTLLPLRV